MNESSRIRAGAKKRNRTSTGVTPLEPESKGQFPSKQEQGKNKQEFGSQGGQPRSPETIQGQRPKGNPKDGRTHTQSCDPSPNPGAAELPREHLGHVAVSEAPLPEALRGCSDFARWFVEWSRSVTVPTPEQDRAIIRRALDVLQAWDEWVYDRAPLDAAFESLRDSLVASGYLDAKGVVNG